MYNYNPGEINDPQYQAAYRRAERRVKAKLGFYWHLACYVIINGMLILIYLITGPFAGFYTYPWFIWPMFGWGIGLLFHFMGVFVFGNTDNEDVRRRMIEEEMRRMGVYNPNYNSSPIQPGMPNPGMPTYETSFPPPPVPPDKKS